MNPRKPAKVHAISGRARAVLNRVNELDIPAGEVGAAPGWLDADGLEEWNRLVEHPQYSAVLHGLHRAALIQYCALWSKQVKNLRGDEDAPKMTTMDVQTLSSLMGRFGLTPVDQARVNMPAKKQAGKFDKFKAS